MMQQPPFVRICYPNGLNISICNATLWTKQAESFWGLQLLSPSDSDLHLLSPSDSERCFPIFKTVG